MCGINGFNFKDEGLIKTMNETTHHRGPDATGVFVDEGISIGNNRLSIIDLDPSANQPMFDQSGDLVIVYNGELYNFLDLKKEIGDRYQFKTKSDTEVILAAYHLWGEKAFKKFNGMFAFAIWNKKTKELLLVRDPMGIKPLYYYFDGKKLIFSSEMKAILNHPIPRILNREAFEHYMRILYVPGPLTMIKGISKLPQGHFATLRGDKFSILPFVGEVPQKTNDSYSKSVSRVRELTQKAVERQLVSDRPLGVYLSGGIDSSVVLYSALQSRPSMDAFSVGFDLGPMDESPKFNADLVLARETAKIMGATHHTVSVSPSEVPDLFEKVIYQMDEPVSNPTAIPMMKLASFAREKVVVTLSGDGGDELFGGYERYRLSYVASLYQKFLPKGVRSVLNNMNSRLEKLNTASGVDRFALFMFQKDSELKSLLSPEFSLGNKTRDFFAPRFSKRLREESFEEQFMNMDMQSWLPDQALHLADTMSMSASLEQRVPLLDLELVSYAQSLPLSYKLNTSSGKKIFKDAFRDVLPKTLFDQPKRGWFSPGAKWLRYPEVSAFAKDVLRKDYYPETADMFNWKEVDKMISRHVERRGYHLNPIWSLITFQVWAKHYSITI